jgi:hypothetical protein
MKTPTPTLLETARSRRHTLGGRHELHGTIHAYCPNGERSVREVTLRVKEYDARTPDTSVCPACRQALKVHGVKI